MNTIGYFEIQSTNPKREVDFYTTLFGWKFEKIPNMPIEYYHIITNTIQGGLLQRPSEIPPIHCGSNAFVCSIQVENIDKMMEQILALGGKVAMPKFAVPNKCWQAYFLDLDNNTIGLFQVDENAE